MNWGKGIAIALILFIAFIVTLGVIMIKADANLVSEDYYIKEVKYGSEIVAQNNAKKNDVKLSTDFTTDGVMFTLSATEVEEGTLLLRRSNDPAMDVKMTLEGKNIFVDRKVLNAGKYDVVIDWILEGQSYQIRDILWIP
jgi:hypothetical protein